MERKFIEKDDKIFINLLWEKCIPRKLFEFIKQKENFMKIKLLTLKYASANEIIKKFIENDPANIEILKHYFKANSLKYQYVYATLFPRCLCRVDEYGLKCKSEFDCLINENYKPAFDFTVPLVDC